jgi:hypothetical protein
LTTFVEIQGENLAVEIYEPKVRIADVAGKRGYGYEILDQLAMEHLMGVLN